MTSWSACWAPHKEVMNWIKYGAEFFYLFLFYFFTFSDFDPMRYLAGITPRQSLQEKVENTQLNWALKLYQESEKAIAHFLYSLGNVRLIYMYCNSALGHQWSSRVIKRKHPQKIQLIIGGTDRYFIWMKWVVSVYIVLTPNLMKWFGCFFKTDLVIYHAESLKFAIK